MFSLAVTGNSVTAQTKYAFLVGINNYQSSPLSGCVNDTINLRNLLVSNYGFARENVVVMTDEKATRANILAGLESFRGKVRRAATFLFSPTRATGLSSRIRALKNRMKLKPFRISTSTRAPASHTFPTGAMIQRSAP